MKTIQLLLLLSALAVIQSQDCNNPLLDILDIGRLPVPTRPVGTLTFCPNFATQNVCCDTNTINGFQARVDSALTNLQNIAAQRDRWLTQSYNDIFPTFLSNWHIFQSSMEALRVANQAAHAAALIKFAYINITAGSLRLAIAPLRENFANYQNSRVQCFQTMMDYLASAHCLACNPNYRNLGVSDDGNIALNTRVCTTIKNSCFRFVQLSNFYSLFISLRQVSDQLFEANEFLRDLDLGNDDLVNEIQDEEVPYENDSAADQDILDPTIFPPNCTNPSDCNWLCSDVFNSAQINTQLLALGGVPVDSLDFGDITIRANGTGRIVNGTGRILQASNNDTNVEIGDGEANATIPVVGSSPDAQGDNADNVDANDTAIGSDPVSAEGEDDTATGPITTGEVLTPAPAPVTGTWNPAVGQSGAVITVLPNPGNVALVNTIDENVIRTSAQAFQEPPDPNSNKDESQGSALSGSALAASLILLLISVLVYLE